jgi:hypothetical protein
MNKTALKFSIMITSVTLATMLAGVWLADIDREHDSQAVLLPDKVMTLFPDPKPLTAFSLTDQNNRYLIFKPEGQMVFSLFRLHPLPGRLSDDPGDLGARA